MSERLVSVVQKTLLILPIRTGIALTIEMTGNLDLALPLLVSCLAATFAAEALGARPIYEILLERTLARDAVKDG